MSSTERGDTTIYPPTQAKDNEPWGDTMQIKRKIHLEFISKKVNGIQIQLLEIWECIITTSMNGFKSNIVGLCEKSLNWKLLCIRNKTQSFNSSCNKRILNSPHSTTVTQSKRYSKMDRH